MDNYDTTDPRDRGELYSKPVRAGKRTYFFDVKPTRKSDYYLTITESKKRTEPDGGVTYEKHKIFLYKEDFGKFMDGLQDAFDFIRQNVDPDLFDHADDYENGELPAE